MRPGSGELWGHHLMPQQIDVDCLLPTGIIVILRCNRDATLESLKVELWREAKKHPLFYLLCDPSAYIFVSITQDAEREEFYDETRRLCDLHLFQPILKVIEPKGNKEEKILNSEIGNAIGISENEFSKMKDLEVLTFRRQVLQTCQQAISLRESRGPLGALMYAYSPEAHEAAKLPPHLEEKLQKEMKNSLIVCIWVVSASGDKQKYSVKVPHTALPEDVIAEAIRKRTFQMSMSQEDIRKCVLEYQDTYILKVCGCSEFLLESFPISQYKYIRKSLQRNRIPQLMLMSKEGVVNNLPKNTFLTPSYVKRGISALSTITKEQTKSLWELDNSKLRIRINCATYVNVRETGKIYVRTGIYHGTDSLCPTRDTEQVESGNPRWGEWLEYDLCHQDIPRSARLAISLCCVSRKSRAKRGLDYALGWANLNLFDFNARLLSDKMSLHLWPIPQGQDDLLNPVGMPGSNPNQDSPCLEIEFEKFSPPVSFPSDDQIERYAHFLANPAAYGDYRRVHGSTTTLAAASPSEEYAEYADLGNVTAFAEITRRDPLAEISEQEKEVLWAMRRECLAEPDSLPKLLAAVHWNSRKHVTQLYGLLKEWPDVLPHTALQLLYATYTDLAVRTFAVECLEKNLRDEQLSMYLLQLVQVLKFEPYLDNALTHFLLKRSLLNQRIGHFFFWHLKAEMSHPQHRLRFGLILEAYLRSCGSYLKSLNRQVDAIEKLTKLTDALKFEKELDNQYKFLLSQVRQADYIETLQNFSCPLSHSLILGELVESGVKVMQSKKRPLWLTWLNPDPMADMMQKDTMMIFKNGDDLRQDMLTLQIIGIMDNIWQSEGLDLRMTPYGCLATGQSVGVIECVRDARTVMNIMQQGTLAKIQLDTKELHRWIKDKNKGEKYEEAIATFTRSCAGYCVATFILGIGDRHPDNIMVSEEGKVFHIDFGHFLDHRKKKWGINRERVPFVLTEDFIRVIAKGSDNPTKSKEFDSFQELCYRAYLQLRQHAHIIITLFVMMLSCGIPELQSLDDIGYIRKTLQVEKTEEEAFKYFQKQLNEAHGSSVFTKVDWFFHWANLKKKN